MPGTPRLGQPSADASMSSPDHAPTVVLTPRSRPSTLGREHPRHHSETHDERRLPPHRVRATGALDTTQETQPSRAWRSPEIRESSGLRLSGWNDVLTSGSGLINPLASSKALTAGSTRSRWIPIPSDRQRCRWRTSSISRPKRRNRDLSPDPAFTTDPMQRPVGTKVHTYPGSRSVDPPSADGGSTDTHRGRPRVDGSGEDDVRRDQGVVAAAGEGAVVVVRH